jgi:hypothetical protein
METLPELVIKLNGMLDSETFSNEEFLSILNGLIERFNPRLKILDFEFNNEDRLRLLKGQKMKEVKLQNFVRAAELRDMEKLCMDYIELRKTLGTEKSMFYHEDEYLCYFHMGTSRNDGAVIRLLEGFIHEKGM